MKTFNIKKVLAISLALIIFCAQISVAADIDTKEESFVSNYTEDKFELNDEVKTGQVDVLKSVTYNNDKTFNISLKTQETGFKIEKTSQNEYNIVFVIDNSGSMYGTSGRAEACVNAINSVIKDLANSPNIKISVVTYSSGSHLDYSSEENEEDYRTSNTVSADTLLNLKHYGEDTYIGYVDNYGDGEGKDINKRNQYRWMYSSTGKKFYAGNTNTQAGIIKAYEVLKGAENKDTATPVIILMSDGEATNYAYSKDYMTDYKYELESMSELDNFKSAFSNDYTLSQLAGYNAILSANFVKAKINSLYKKSCIFYTLGYSLEQNYDYSSATLDPTNSKLNKSGNYMKKDYEKYGLDYLVNSSEVSKSFKSKYKLSSLKYNNKYYEGTVNNIKSIYKKMVNDSLTEYEYHTPIKNSTYLTITDELGDKFKIDIQEDKIKMKLLSIRLDDNKKEEKEITLTKKNAKIYQFKDNNIEINYDLENKQIIFKALAEFVDQKKLDLSFKILLEDDAKGSIEGNTYYTNNTKNTYYEFVPEENNTYYGKGIVKENIDSTGSITLKILEEEKEPEEPKESEEPQKENNEKEVNNVTINNKTETNNNNKEKNKIIEKEKEKITTNKVTVQKKLPKTGRDQFVFHNIKLSLKKK